MAKRQVEKKPTASEEKIDLILGDQSESQELNEAALVGIDQDVMNASVDPVQAPVQTENKNSVHPKFQKFKKGF